MARVADASAKLYPKAEVVFRVLNCETALEWAEDALGRFGYELDPDDVQDGWIGARVTRRAGHVHVNEALLRLYRCGAIRGREEA